MEKCHITYIFDALNIEQINRYLNRIQFKFLIRPTMTNDLTKEILSISIEINFKNSFVSIR
jgi:hypothetical protein